MSLHLTETAIARHVREAAEEKRRIDLADAYHAGLRLRLTPAGGKTWALACRDREGRMRRFSLGTYPTMSLSAARKAAKALHVKVTEEGADPVAKRRRDRAIGRDAKAGIGTLTGLLGLYGTKEGHALKRWDESRRRIESVFAAHLARPLEMMKPADLQMTADSWRAPQSAAAAVRYLRPILKWAERRNYVPLGLSAIVPPATVGRRTRVLSRDELAAVLPVLSSSSRPYAAALRFMLLTLCRREEAGQACWRDVDLIAGTWTIPETKNGQPHVVPLSRQAVELLRSCMPSETPDPEALIFATGTGEALGNWDRETKALMVASGLAVKDKKTKAVTMKDGSALWTRHDLRRTGATMLGDMGELPDIIEAALNHVAIRSALAATYNRSRYRPQVAAALQRLADALDGIEAGAAKVIPLRSVL